MSVKGSRTRFALAAVALGWAFLAASQPVAPREKVLAYFAVTGVLDSIARQVELTADELKRLYPTLPSAFWSDPAVAIVSRVVV